MLAKKYKHVEEVVSKQKEVITDLLQRQHIISQQHAQLENENILLKENFASMQKTVAQLSQFCNKLAAEKLSQKGQTPGPSHTPVTQAYVGPSKEQVQLLLQEYTQKHLPRLVREMAIDLWKKYSARSPSSMGSDIPDIQPYFNKSGMISPRG